MILVELRSDKNGSTITLHPRVTVVAGDAQRERLRRALSADGKGGELIVDVGGERQPLTRDLLAGAGIDAAAVFVDAFPEAPMAPVDTGAIADAEAKVAMAEDAVRDARAALEQAERDYAAAQDAFMSASHEIDDDAATALQQAQARLEVAQAGAAAARRAVVELREAADRDEAEVAARREEVRRRIEQLQAERFELDQQGASLVERLTTMPDPAAIAKVEEALNGLRRLRQVKPKPSARAASLADAWAAAGEALHQLPAPPSPPEWLVTPALAALRDARKAVADAEAGAVLGVDSDKAAAVERVHHDVLEAEQRVMRKGSRLNRRRLEQAQEEERTLLASVGIASYGEYLQKIVPVLDSGGSNEERIASARAALADAEAVWEELHGGAASPEWTAAKEEEERIRSEAIELLGAEVPDDRLEESLRAEVEAVVDTGWAEQALADALREAKVNVYDGSDLEVLAQECIATAPDTKEQRAQVVSLRERVDGRLAEIDEELSRLGPPPADATPAAASSDDGGNEREAASEPFAVLQAALDEAEQAEREAEQALARATERVDAYERQQARAGELEAASNVAGIAVDAARRALSDAEAALDAARSAGAEAAASAESARAAVTAPASAGVEAEAYLLARVLGAAAGGKMPVVIDAQAIAGLPDSGSRRVLSLLDRAGDVVQVVVVGDEPAVTEWAKSLGDRATTASP